MLINNNPEFIPVLTIAGSDNSGGAGIQADLKTFWAFGCFGLSAIAAITAQNVTQFSTYEALSSEILYKQIKFSVLQCKPLSVKTGMLATAENISAVEQAIREFNLPRLVIDPVLKSSTGKNLANDDYLNCLRNTLLPLAYVITPNKMEAEILSEVKIESCDDLIKAAKRINEMGPENVIIKGGHVNFDNHESVDILYNGTNIQRFSAKRIVTGADPGDKFSFHGTGCTFSAALCACLALGYSINDATNHAKQYVLKAMQYRLPGTPNGILNHEIIC